MPNTAAAPTTTPKRTAGGMRPTARSTAAASPVRVRSSSSRATHSSAPISGPWVGRSLTPALNLPDVGLAEQAGRSDEEHEDEQREDPHVLIRGAALDDLVAVAGRVRLGQPDDES